MDVPGHLQRVLEALKGLKRVGDEWQALCPAHDDANPSLSIGLGQAGQVLVNCHAGCNFESIRRALGFEASAFFPPHSGSQECAARPKKSPRIHNKFEDAIKAACPRNHVFANKWKYVDAAGESVFYVARYNSLAPIADGAKPDKQFRPISRFGGGFVVRDPPGPLPLYRLPEILAAPPGSNIYLFEGEKACEAAVALGLLATTTSHGANGSKKTDLAPLAGHNVAMFPDADQPGEGYVASLAEIVTAFNPPATARFVRLPDLPPKGDIVEFIADRKAKGKSDVEIRNEIEGLARDATAIVPDNEQPVVDERRPRRPSVATRAVALATSRNIDLFVDPSQFAYATIEVNGQRDTLRIGDQAFCDWLVNEMYREEQRVPSKSAVNDACAVLRATAFASRIVRPVYVRIAEHQDAVVLDLGRPDHSVALVTAAGWEVVATSPIPFRRPRGLLGLPIPARGGSLELLRRFVNVNDAEWPLLLAWLMATFRASGPFPILALLSDRGAGKSTTARVLRCLIDPNLAPLRSEPKEARDLMITASNSWVVAFDNLSKLPTWLSDALCRLATGGGFATRSLYSNDEEMIFDAQRPALVTAIGDIFTRSDLLDRAVTITPPAISTKLRKPEQAFWAEFNSAHPLILGSLLDVVASGLKNLPSVSLAELPRMADFARWATACEPALGLASGAFMASYSRTQEAAVEVAIDSNSAAAALRDYLLAGNAIDSRTASEVLEVLGARLDQSSPRPPDWPKSASILSNRLHRSISDLRAVGIDVRFERLARTRKRVIHAHLVASTGSQPGELSPALASEVGRRFATTGTAVVGAPSPQEPVVLPGSGVARVGGDDGDGVSPSLNSCEGESGQHTGVPCSAADVSEKSKYDSTKSPSPSSPPSPPPQTDGDGTTVDAVPTTANVVPIRNGLPGTARSPTTACWSCRGTRYFASPERLTWTCARCHPPAVPAEMVWHDVATEVRDG